MKAKFIAYFTVCLLLLLSLRLAAQTGANDTIRVGATLEKGVVYPMILLPELERATQKINDEEVKRIARLRNNVFAVYPYAIAAAQIMKEVNAELDNMDRHRDRKKYLKSIDKKLDETFKQPLKNLSVEQGQILVKLIDRQTGENCFDIIRKYKSTFAAVMWESAGVFFNNNLRHKYDPCGEDKDIEVIVRDIETSSLYRYELYQQQLLLSKVKK